MKHTTFLIFTYLVFAPVMLLNSLSLRAYEQADPNVILVFLDDAGYGDFGLTGASTPTPNIDNLAKRGVHFTDFYVASPVCSNSRAALLTGRYPYRYGLPDVLRHTDDIGLPQAEETMAELFKRKGYSTHIFGKWHLGHAKGALPTNHGFDEFYGIPYSNDMWRYRRDPNALNENDEEAHVYRENVPNVSLPLYDGTKIVKASVTPNDQKVFTKTFTQKAVDVINRSNNKPFFVYLPLTSTHTPLFVSDDMKGTSKGNLYRDVINEIDHGMGRIVKALKDNNQYENTIIVFTSDNGPWLRFGDHAGSTAGLRGGKNNSFEGGVRVFSLMHWPAKLKANTTIDSAVMSIDLLPTFAEILQLKPQGRKLDGRSILKMMTGEEKNTPYAYYYYYRDKLEAMRFGDWKLHLPRDYLKVDVAKNGGFMGSLKVTPMGWELYNLKQDSKESVNVLKKKPKIYKRLRAMAEKFDKKLMANRTPVGKYDLNESQVVLNENSN